MQGEVGDPAGLATVATVGLVAADEITRRRLDLVLARGGFEIPATAETVEELIHACRGNGPHVLVLTCDLSPLQRTTSLSLLRSELPHSPVVVVSASGGRSSVAKALRAGAAGYVHEADVDDVLALTVQAVGAGQTCVPQVTGGGIVPEALSHREKQVLELVAIGLTNFEIAQRLFLSESTIKSHLSTSFRKLDVCSRAEAAAVVLDPTSGIDLAPAAVAHERDALALARR
jgi:DNA-binding NarL/FixJ family response regulator